MKRNTVLAISIISMSCFANEKNVDISGNYHCTGRDPFLNEDYQASLIVTRTEETFQFDWNLGKTEKYKGTGFYVEGIPNFIPVTVVNLNKFPDPNNPYNSGLQAFKIEKDGTLSGHWIYLNKTKRSPVETCRKKK